MYFLQGKERYRQLDRTGRVEIFLGVVPVIIAREFRPFNFCINDLVSERVRIIQHMQQLWRRMFPQQRIQKMVYRRSLRKARRAEQGKTDDE